MPCSGNRGHCYDTCFDLKLIKKNTQACSGNVEIVTTQVLIQNYINKITL